MSNSENNIPQVKDLERRLVARLIYKPTEHYQVNGLEPEHLFDIEARRAFKTIQQFKADGRVWDPVDFMDSPLLVITDYTELIDVPGAVSRIIETHERREAIAKATRIAQLAQSGDIEGLRQLTGVSEAFTSSHPWAKYERTLEDAFRERPPRKYIVDGLIPEASLSIVYSRPGGLKSNSLGSMACCVATGQKWLTQLPTSADDLGFDTTACSVLWLDYDQGETQDDAMFEALARGYNLTENDPISYLVMPKPHLNCRDMASVEMTAMFIRQKGARLVIIDNLTTVSGGIEENSSEMGVVMGNLRWLVEQTRAAIVVIHHDRKSTGFKTRRGEKLRGHSSIEAALDLALGIEREDGSDIFQAWPTKVRGAPVAPFQGLWTFDWKPGTKELQTGRFWGLPMDDTGSDFAVQESVLNILSENQQLNKGTLADKVHDELPDVGLNRIRGVLDLMAQNGAVKQVKGKQGAKYYSLP